MASPESLNRKRHVDTARCCHKAKLIIVIMLAELFLFYPLPYLVLSRIGQEDGIKCDNGECIWAFGGLTQRYGTYGVKGTPEYKREKALRTFFYPLVYLDKQAGNYHFLEEDLPDYGG